MLEMITTSSEISIEWLETALKSRNLLVTTSGEPNRIVSLGLEPIGAGVGLMADLARLRIHYESDTTLPGSMILKCSADGDNKAIAQILDFYQREVNFYNELSGEINLSVPDCYYADIDMSSYNFVILMQDLGDVSPRDQIVGASEAEAFAAIEKIAAVHAKYWEKVHGLESSWMFDAMSQEESEKLGNYVFRPSLEPALEKFPDFFDETTTALCRLVSANFPVYWSSNLSPFKTFIHGDYRQDNFIYHGDSLDAVVMDWQISGKGKPIFDVTYFICQSLKSELRLKIERPLIQHYVDTLVKHGVSEYGFDAAFLDYRTNILACLVYPITVCGTLDLANERGRALAECMLSRNLAAIKDLNCSELL